MIGSILGGGGGGGGALGGALGGGGVWEGRLGRMQVNTALHTCTAWYAYAAMFGSSWMTQSMAFIEIYVTGWPNECQHICKPVK